MSTIEQQLAIGISQAIADLYHEQVDFQISQLQKTRKEFNGDFTIVVFPYLKMASAAKGGKTNPQEVASEIGKYLKQHLDIVDGYAVVGGFLNIAISTKFWVDFVEKNISSANFGFAPAKSNGRLLIEYSSPNTNKPLHLGHVRNNLLGYSVAKIMEANGYEVIKVNLVNDRGIHICKSMLAWLKYGNGETPESSGKKGDHLVGDYYVLFDKKYREEIAQLVAGGMAKEEAEKQAPLMKEAQEMLRKWEADDPEIRALWEKMNNWVYDGFNDTYQRLGVSFDKIYYESQTYLLGKSLVEEGLQNGTLYRRENGSVWANLTDEGLDEKLLLRSDGTSVYMTQDLGTAQLRMEEFNPQKMIYVVGNEQNYHFEVLKLVLKKKLKKDWADGIYHLSYGMVELPNGKMKSREGTVVDADDLIDAMVDEARQNTERLGKTAEFSSEEALQLYTTIGMGALKYFILKVDPKKNMLFNPEESIDFNGNTGPFIQYTHARIKSLLRKASESGIDITSLNFGKIDTVLPAEQEIIRKLYDFPETVRLAGEQFSPAQIANYVFELVKTYNQFYQETNILRETDAAKKHFRLAISQFTATTIKQAMGLLGISVPNKM